MTSNTITIEPATWSADEFVGAFDRALSHLTANVGAVNAMNVFPVPDGDTGTNMHATLLGAVTEAQLAPPGSDIAAVAARLARGALLSARGNSGVILSEALKGLASGLPAQSRMAGADFANALTLATETAYRAVANPVEGTMLTVIRTAADAARAAAAHGAGLDEVLERATEAASNALADTPRLMPLLREAGVVDAGGQGIVLMLEGLLGRIETRLTVVTPVVSHDSGEPLGELLDGVSYGFCTNFIISGDRLDLDRVRSELDAHGRSLVVIGDEAIARVHLHTLDPERAIDHARGFGVVSAVSLQNMDEQVQARLPHDDALLPSDGPAVIAVASGRGLAETLRSFGATLVVSGGATMNPSVNDLLAAVERCAADEVILLPNNRNILLAAQGVKELTSKTTAIVPTRTVPQALAALSRFNPDRDAAANVAAMTAALSSVRTIDVTLASRRAEIHGVIVEEGSPIALLDDDLVASGATETAVLLDALGMARADSAELITMFFGEGVSPSAAASLASEVAAAYPHAAVECLSGGQPNRQYIVAVE